MRKYVGLLVVSVLSVVALVGGVVFSQNLTRVVPAAVAGSVRIESVVSGVNTTTILTTDGQVYVRGSNVANQLMAGDAVSVSSWLLVDVGEKVSQVSSTYNHTVVLTVSGKVFSWGENRFSATGSDSSVVSEPVQVTAAQYFVSIVSGLETVYGLDSDGFLYAWGGNSRGQLGDGTMTESSTPINIASGTTFSKVFTASEGYTVFAIDTDNNLWSWGENSVGQLGDGTTSNVSTPTIVSSGYDWDSVAISPNGESVIALDVSGALWSWGSNQNGLLADGTDWRAEQEKENQRVEDEVAAIKEEDAKRKQDLIDQCIAEYEGSVSVEADNVEDDTETDDTVSPSPSVSASPSASPSAEPELTDDEIETECTTQVEEDFEETDTSDIKAKTIEEPSLGGGYTYLHRVYVTETVSGEENEEDSVVSFSAIALSNTNGYAITTDGFLYAWGSDEYGATGLGLDDSDTTSHHTQVPVRVYDDPDDPGSSDYRTYSKVVAGEHFAIVLAENGHIYGLGQNTDNIFLMDTVEETNSGSVSASPSVSPSPTESNDSSGETYPSSVNVITGADIAMNVKDVKIFNNNRVVYEDGDGNVHAWGDNTNNVFLVDDFSTEEDSVIVEDTVVNVPFNGLTFVNDSALALKDNILAYWGTVNSLLFVDTEATDGDVLDTVSQPIVDTFTAVSAGYMFSLLLDENGNAWGVGFNGLHNYGVTAGEYSSKPVRLSVKGTVTNILATKTSSFVVTDDGHIYSVGNDVNKVTYHSIVVEKTVVSLVPYGSDGRDVAILFKDGTVALWDDFSGKTTDTTLTGIKSLTGAVFGLIGVKEDGSLDTSKVIDSDALTMLETIQTAVDRGLIISQISAQENFMIILDTEGYVWGIGTAPYGIFGDTTTVNTLQLLTLEENN